MEEFFEAIILIVFGGIFFITTIFEICWPIAIPILIISQLRKNKSNQAFKNNVIKTSKDKEGLSKITQDVDKSKLEPLDIDDINKLKNYLYQIYFDFEKAYNDLDYNTMLNTSTPKLYNAYHTNIMLNLKCGQKKIIENTKLIKCIVYDILCTNRKQVISTIIEVENVSYMQDYNGKVVSGSVNPIKEKFEVIFIKNYAADTSVTCPNCQASVSGNKCEYCGTEVRNSEFRIDSIKKIVD